MASFTGLDLAIEAGKPADSDRLMPVLERHIASYGAAPRQAVAYGGFGGESESDLTRLKGYRAMPRKKWPTLTYFDLSQIKNEAHLASEIGERYSLPHAQALADVAAWMAGKTF